MSIQEVVGELKVLGVDPNTDDRFSDVASALDEDDAPKAVEKVLKHLEKVKQIPIKIAVTGESGAGKSTLVNALRGVDDTASDAAPTGCVETTMEPTKYPHPNFPNITIWDLPGIGTTRMKAEEYLKHVGFQKYDFFLIVSDTRFRENDAKLALEIQKMEKKFYFLRSKIDHNVSDEKRKGRSETETLEKIRENCEKELIKLGIKSPKIFLVSSFDMNKYEFPILMETLQTEMPKHQRDALLLAVPSYNQTLIQKKKEVLKGRIVGYTTLVVLATLVPVPGVGTSVDISLINWFADEGKEAFGLTEQSLIRLSKASNVPVDSLKAELTLSLVSDVGGYVFGRVNPELSGTALAISFLSPIAATLSGIGFPGKMHYVADTLAEEALKVFKRAIELGE